MILNKLSFHPLRKSEFKPYITISTNNSSIVKRKLIGVEMGFPEPLVYLN